MNNNKNKAVSRSWWQKWVRSTLDTSVLNHSELIQELRQAQKNNIIGSEALGMIEGVMQVDNLQVRDIMIPRSNIQFLHHDDSFHDILKVVMKAGHSRYPVFDEDRDDVEGILLAKDLLKYVGNENAFDIDDILRRPIVVPESQKLDILLRSFRNSRNHMAIVVDEYAGTSGVITIEDVLEQIVGEIDDEHDHVDEKLNIRAQKDGRFTVQASTEIEEFNDYFSANLIDDRFDTIGGLITQKSGCIPQQGDEILLESFQFKVLRSDARRVNLLEVNRVSK
ncbi:Magnesium and cobalt efflux protein CorC [Nymphon striatum]|nr:Magnesium and cobalt efflux protein CorC [Nymphon striatum]